MYDIQFTDTVGVSPGTTTMTLSGANSTNKSVEIFDPYASDAYLSGGLRDVDPNAPAVTDPNLPPPPIRWTMIVAVGLAVLGGTLGYGWLKRHDKLG